MNADVSAFSHQLRTRVCGLLVQPDAILLIQLHSPVTDKLLWMPPGGGIEFGETMEECLKREFHEETNLEIEVGELVHINELVSPPFHALEFYFEVSKKRGQKELGSDPELGSDKQLLKDLRWIPFSELDRIPWAPQSLEDKLKNWGQRDTYPIFTGS
ncbi:NUDIX domain-containing protein [Fodinibius halophilus]|uniref:NUDIX domain-containing protein n=1 Tax=Fodinibius halophilus TaxID=1736908 RepID=A0A6M1T5J6_9BACT|nr:NUDIX domain-containing protein [Fodinibius halophilus]NGP89329.1 NUDIX domain-containing protein [Fodinibius halophilus]